MLTASERAAASSQYRDQTHKQDPKKRSDRPRTAIAGKVAEQLAPAETNLANAAFSLMALSVISMAAIKGAELPRVLGQDDSTSQRAQANLIE